MSNRIETKLDDLGIHLEAPSAPAANYVPFVVTGNLVFISGQIPVSAGVVKYEGQVGSSVSVEQAQEAARLCVINILTHLKQACDGDLDRVRRCIKLGGFVCCGPDFNQQHIVMNGASDLIVEVLGEAGRHTRFAVGASSLPFGVSVEVDAIFEIA